MKRRGGGSHPRPVLPKVNLLSQGDLDRITARRLRKRFVAGGAVLVVLVGAGWFVQHQRVSDSEKLLTVEQAETARLSQQSQQFTAIKTFVAGVDGQKQTLAATMAQEIYFSTVLSGLQAASPIGTSMQSISVTLAPAAGAGTTTTGGTTGTTTGSAVCPGPDPFHTETVVGCVTLSGTAVSRAEVGELVTRLGNMNLFVEPFVNTTSTGDAQAVTFSGSVGLSDAVYSLRYGPAPTAAPTTTPDPSATGATTGDAATATGGAS
jgi:hypothetical protein